jgi:hypothetical protein
VTHMLKKHNSKAFVGSNPTPRTFVGENDGDLAWR